MKFKLNKLKIYKSFFMAAGLKYFIGNWKMFGVISSFNIINKLNSFLSKDKNNKNIKL